MQESNTNMYNWGSYGIHNPKSNNPPQYLHLMPKTRLPVEKDEIMDIG